MKRTTSRDMAALAGAGEAAAGVVPEAARRPLRELMDDLVFSGQTLRSAREALGLVGLDAGTASAILWTYRADASVQELTAAGMTEITCLVHQSAIPVEQ